MDLGPTTPKKQPGALASKRLIFLAVAALCLVAGIVLRSAQYFGAPEEAKTPPTTIAAPSPPVAASPATETIAPAPTATQPAPTASPAPAQQAVTEPNEQPAGNGATTGYGSEASEGTASTQPPSPSDSQSAPSDSGMILVSRQPIEMLASPSASAPTMYGFPAGRPFRVIGRDGTFVQIQDLKSSASGWINEAALAPPPRMPVTAAPPQGKAPVSSQKTSADAKPKAPSKGGQFATDTATSNQSDTVQAPRRPGLFGGGGLFGGIFRNGN